MLEFGEYITIADALLLSVVSISIVFAVLALIAIIINCIGKLMQKKESTVAPVTTVINNTQKNEMASTKVNLSDVKKDEQSLIAVLVASIDANKNDEDKKYKVSSIREI